MADSRDDIRRSTPREDRSLAVRRTARLRRRVRRYRRLSVGLAAALALAVAALAGLPLPADPSGAVDLGAGLAGVGEPAPEAPAETRRLGEGSASYYSDALEGRSTASGQPYRGAELTAAHRTLPFGSRVRVTHLGNGRSIVVRINDRGPYARHRVIDLSRTAASRLGMLSQGHARVRLELLE